MALTSDNTKQECFHFVSQFVAQQVIAIVPKNARKIRKIKICWVFHLIQVASCVSDRLYLRYSDCLYFYGANALYCTLGIYCRFILERQAAPITITSTYIYKTASQPQPGKSQCQPTDKPICDECLLGKLGQPSAVSYYCYEK